MAYLRDLAERCMGCKVRDAKVELINRKNAVLGKFCRSCGNSRLARLKKREERMDAGVERFQEKERKA